MLMLFSVVLVSDVFLNIKPFTFGTVTFALRLTSRDHQLGLGEFEL